MKTFEVFNHACSGFVESELLEMLGGGNNLWKYRFRNKAGEVIQTCCPGTYIKNFSPVDFFQPGLEIETEKGYRLIVDRAEKKENGNIRVFWKYLENGWSKNSYGVQFKKIQEGYNFITVDPEDSVKIVEISGDVLKENRYSWYFDEYVNPETIVFLEKKLEYIMESGKTWYEYFLESPNPRVPKKTGDGEMYWVDMTDPKNPRYPEWVKISGKDVILEKTIKDIEELIISIHND